MASAKSMFLMSAAVLLIAVGFALLAQSAIALAGAGGGAIAVMAGLTAAVIGFAFGMMAMLKIGFDYAFSDDNESNDDGESGLLDT